mgnify:CR=1 FL=1
MQCGVLNMTKRACATCGKKLTRRQEKYCSHACYSRSLIKGEVRDCPICGQQFYASQAETKRGKAKYCSAGCQYLSISEQFKSGENLDCEVCGQSFYVPQHRLADADRGKYCSPECYWKTRSEKSKKAWRSGVYDDVFVSPTSIEIATAQALSVLGLPFTQEWRPDNYSRIFDFLIPPDVVIEVQGDYWHSMTHVARRDAEKAQWAKDNGYQLVEFWEHEIKDRGATELVEERVLPLVGD